MSVNHEALGAVLTLGELEALLRSEDWEAYLQSLGQRLKEPPAEDSEAGKEMARLRQNIGTGYSNRARRATDLFTEHAGRTKIEGAATDRFGNAEGTGYDLGRDGAFEGHTVHALQLYTEPAKDELMGALYDNFHGIPKLMGGRLVTRRPSFVRDRWDDESRMEGALGGTPLLTAGEYTAALHALLPYALLPYALLPYDLRQFSSEAAIERLRKDSPAFSALFDAQGPVPRRHRAPARHGRAIAAYLRDDAKGFVCSPGLPAEIEVALDSYLALRAKGQPHPDGLLTLELKAAREREAWLQEHPSPR